MKTYFYLIFFVCVIVSCGLAEKQKRYAHDHLSIAVSLIKDCDYKRAVTHLLKAISFSKKDPLLRHTLASTYFLMRQYDLAGKEFKKTLEIKKDFTEARVNLARTYIEQGSPNRALRELKLAEKDITYTNYIKLIGTKGLAFFKKKKYRQMEKWLLEMKTLAKTEQDKCFVFLYLGRMELTKGNLDRAEGYLVQALTQCQKALPLCEKPQFEEQYFLAETYVRKKDLSRAEYQLKVFLNRTDERNPYRKKAQRLFEKIKKKRNLKKAKKS